LERVRTSTALDRAPLLQGVWFSRAPDGLKRLGLVVHPWVADGGALRIFSEDLRQALHQLQAAQPIRLAPTTAHFLRWAELITAEPNAHVHSADVALQETTA